MNILLFIAIIYAKIIKNKKPFLKNKKILALPYYSLHYAGGHSRIGDWKPYFENKGIPYEVHWASKTNEFLSELIPEKWHLRYWFYSKVLWRRFLLIFSIHKYHTVWVQRAFIPFFPFKDAYFEKIIVKINNNIIVDFYDADYESNYNLTINTAASANKVTVASKYLVEFFRKKNITTHFVRYAMNYDEYLVQSKQSDEKIIIGWMGAPANFSNVLLIEDELIAIENKYPNVEFHFICREIKALRLKRWKQSKWGDDGFDYHKTISSFDIGIAPMINATERDKARTAFKTIEYMASALPFVTSPWGTSDKLIDNVNCLYANDKNEWVYKLELLIKSKRLRNQLGLEARKTLVKDHSYSNVFEDLYAVLVS